MRIYHVEYPTPKHVENSIRGVKHAASHGYDAIDLDMQITADSVIVGTHWAKPMERDGFRDPLRRISKAKRVNQLSWAKISRLRAGKVWRLYKISKIQRLMQECARRNIVAYLEPKSDPRFEYDWPWQQIRSWQKLYGTRVKVRTLRDLGGEGAGLKRAAAARRAGFDVVVMKG